MIPALQSADPDQINEELINKLLKFIRNPYFASMEASREGLEEVPSFSLRGRFNLPNLDIDRDTLLSFMAATLGYDIELLLLLGDTDLEGTDPRTRLLRAGDG